tara:strand:+ start:83 stop:280 length:198 start_codon:yes stop_codon:yes gene_type:complete
MQPRLRRGSGSNDQAMQVFIKTLVEKIDEILLAFSKPAMKKQEYIRHYFLDEALERREADSLRNI